MYWYTAVLNIIVVADITICSAIIIKNPSIKRIVAATIQAWPFGSVDFNRYTMPNPNKPKITITSNENSGKISDDETFWLKFLRMRSADLFILSIAPSLSYVITGITKKVAIYQANPMIDPARSLRKFFEELFFFPCRRSLIIVADRAQVDMVPIREKL